MKDFTNKEWDVMLCSTGYLPPRNDEELMFFNQMYEGYKPRIANRHVDVDAIINGKCNLVPSSVTDDYIPLIVCAAETVNDNQYSMAARNYEKLPKKILDKMKNQHKPKDGKD